MRHSIPAPGMGAVMRRRGESVFCAGAGGSRRKRPRRRPCKNRRTQAAFERTARWLRRERRRVRKRSAVLKQPPMRERQQPGAQKNYSTRPSKSYSVAPVIRTRTNLPTLSGRDECTTTSPSTSGESNSVRPM